MCAFIFDAYVSVAQTPSANVGTKGAPPVAESSPSPASDLHIGAGDLIDVHVYGAPELSESLRVSNSGEVSMPLIGDVKIGGLTTAEAQGVIEQSYVNGATFVIPTSTFHQGVCEPRCLSA